MESLNQQTNVYDNYPAVAGNTAVAVSAPPRPAAPPKPDRPTRRPSPEQQQCVHHFIIARADASARDTDGWSLGQCRKCDLVRRFDNYGRTPDQIANGTPDGKPARINPLQAAAQKRAAEARRLAELGHTPEDLCRHFNVNMQTITRYLNEGNNPANRPLRSDPDAELEAAFLDWTDSHMDQ